MVNRYGLVGYPLGHSFSERYFRAKFLREGIDARYDLFPLSSIRDLPSLIDNIPSLVGLNVTAPYKRTVIQYLDHVDEKVRIIGAANVIRIERINGKRFLIGFNSDAPAFESSLQALNLTKIKKCLILGTGGASDAVGYALSSLNIDWCKVSRLSGERQYEYAQLTEEIISQAQLIVNTTPVGMYPEITAVLPFPFHFLTPAHFCYDLIYNPAITSFLREACENGAWVKNGLEMLYNQAEISWNLWNS